MPHHDMKDDTIIFGISMMLMAVPVAGLNVNLYIPFGEIGTIHYDCIPKVGTTITVGPSRVDDSDWDVFCGEQLFAHHLLPYQSHVLLR
jgi:hypothetical protein